MQQKILLGALLVAGCQMQSAHDMGEHAAHGSTSEQDWAKKRLADSPRHQEWIEVKNGSRTVKCFVVYPEKKDKATTVVVIHEIMGLTDWVQGVADQLAEKGYIAIAPDFLSGIAPNGGRTTDFA